MQARVCGENDFGARRGASVLEDERRSDGWVERGGEEGRVGAGDTRPSYVDYADAFKFRLKGH